MTCSLFKLLVCLLVAASSIGQDLETVGDVFDLVGSMLNLADNLMGQRDGDEQDGGDSSGRSDSITGNVCPVPSDCTGFKQNATKFTDCGLCNSTVDEDQKIHNDRQCLAACLTYRDNRVKQDEVGCKKLPNGATTSIDDCTCILNLIYPYLFRNSTYNGTGPTLTQVHRGVTASEYTPCPGQS